VFLTRPPLAWDKLPYAFDLHVLGTPPAFILSQDQTRHPMFYVTQPGSGCDQLHCKRDPSCINLCLACSQMSPPRLPGEKHSIDRRYALKLLMLQYHSCSSSAFHSSVVKVLLLRKRSLPTLSSNSFVSVVSLRILYFLCLVKGFSDDFSRLPKTHLFSFVRWIRHTTQEDQVSCLLMEKPENRRSSEEPR
jgi:hypothetical protein